MTEVTYIALDKLAACKDNVRKTFTDQGMTELTASIRAHGLLQSLVVRKQGKKYSVVAGNRRFTALTALCRDGEITKDYAVPCRVIDVDADATEISLAENAVREQMHPADEFEAFRALADKGLPAADIAARFGVSETVVLKRLKLARVSPIIIQAYRDGEITLEVVMAFAVTDDRGAQEKLWKSMPHYMREEPQDIRRALTEDDIGASDRRVKFVGLKAYEKAGGKTRRDLFAEDDDGIFILDAGLLADLAAAKLTKAAEKVRKEGWKWVEIRDSFDYSEWSRCERRHEEYAPLPLAEQAKLEALEQEYDALEKQWQDSDDADAEYPERLYELSDLMDAISETREEIWPAETLAIAGAIIGIGHDGKTDIRRGYVLPQDKPARRKPDAAQGSDNQNAAEPEKATLSASLTQCLTGHRSAAISAALADAPDIALAAVVHAFVCKVFYNYSRDSSLQILAVTTALPKEAKGYEALERKRESWGDRLPGSPAQLWPWLLDQDQSVLLDLLAFCAAHTVDAIVIKGREDNSANAQILADALRLDMAAWFTPTAENYFSRIGKADILAALEEAKGVPPSPAQLKMKKSELAALAERELAGTGWLPKLLREAA